MPRHYPSHASPPGRLGTFFHEGRGGLLFRDTVTETPSSLVGERAPGLSRLRVMGQSIKDRRRE